MSFEESMTAFYMAFAEQRVEQACQALGGMRLAAAAGRGQGDGALREEVRFSASQSRLRGFMSARLQSEAAHPPDA